MVSVCVVICRLSRVCNVQIKHNSKTHLKDLCQNLSLSHTHTLSYERVTDVIICCSVVFVLMSTGEMVIRNSILNPQEIRKHTLKLAFSVLHTNTALNQRH